MTLQPTQGIFMPPMPAMNLFPQFSNVGQIDATGEKFAFIGRVWNKDRASKNITKVGFRFGVVTKAGGSGLTVSLQNVDTANGPVFRPDETQDQTVAIANGNASFASSAWIQTAALSASRTVSFGEPLAVVIEYDGSGRLGADSVQISMMTGSNNTFPGYQSGAALLTASWASIIGYNNVILEFDDGSFGTLDEAMPASAINTHAFNSGTGGADEHALAFTVPFACKVDGIWAYMQTAGNTSDFDLILYEGTTALASGSFDANTLLANANARGILATIAEQTLSVGTQYYVAVKPTTANNVSCYSLDVANASHLQAVPGGTAWQYSSRVDGGSWAANTTTRRLMAGIRISALSDNVSSGGSRWFG